MFFPPALLAPLPQIRANRRYARSADSKIFFQTAGADCSESDYRCAVGYACDSPGTPRLESDNSHTAALGKDAFVAAAQRLVNRLTKPSRSVRSCRVSFLEDRRSWYPPETLLVDDGLESLDRAKLWVKPSLSCSSFSRKGQGLIFERASFSRINSISRWVASNSRSFLIRFKRTTLFLHFSSSSFNCPSVSRCWDSRFLHALLLGFRLLLCLLHFGANSGHLLA